MAPVYILHTCCSQLPKKTLFDSRSLRIVIEQTKRFRKKDEETKIILQTASPLDRSSSDGRGYGHRIRVRSALSDRAGE